jgi:hypothetical protein
MSVDMTPATDKQLNYILHLAGCKYFSQVAHVTRLLMTQRAKRGDLWKTEASAIIDDLLALKNGDPEPTPPGHVSYVVLEYRKWEDNKYATNGRAPSRQIYFAWGDEGGDTIKDIHRSAGHLAEIVWRGQGDPDAAAKRAWASHRGAYRVAGAHGHDRLLKHLMPNADPDKDLIVDVTPNQLRTALRRKTTRTGWVADALRKWCGNGDLAAHVSPETLAVIAVLGTALTDGEELTGPEAQELVGRALEACRVVAESGCGEYGLPVPWAVTVMSGITGIELPEHIVARLLPVPEAVST